MTPKRAFGMCLTGSGIIIMGLTVHWSAALALFIFAWGNNVEQNS